MNLNSTELLCIFTISITRFCNNTLIISLVGNCIPVNDFVKLETLTLNSMSW
ncbi:hypothetical protein HanPSC8_Chr10g0417421 [Helianthus annuus]|nr:hypothetical protein HanPSC8_Chr10g0417421 [Helianthus annuus]